MTTTAPSLTPSTLTYEEAIAELLKPLPSHLIEVRPGATTKDKKRAIALAYYDWRIMVNRLNRVVGGRNWQADLVPWGGNKLICTLTLLGVSKSSVGEAEADDENCGTSAEQQAKKRAMAEHGFNYLYLLPQVWGDYDEIKKCFTDPVALVQQMYAKAHIEGLDLKPYITKGGKTERPTSKADTAISAPSAPATSTSSTTQPALDPRTVETAGVDGKVIAAIGKLSRALKLKEPDYSTLNPTTAKQLLTKLNNQYRAEMARSAPASPSSK